MKDEKWLLPYHPGERGGIISGGVNGVDDWEEIQLTS